MSTFTQMVDDTLMYLYGFTTQQDQATYLTSSITASSTSLPVADASALSRGLVEIEDELLWVDSVNGTSLIGTVPPYGRGYRGTTAASHSSGVRVVSSPLFPRALVRKAINEAIQSVYPDVWGTGSTTFTFNPAVSTYALPSGAIDALQVTWQSIGPSKEWMPIRRYNVDNTADTTSFPTGSTVSIYDAVVPGRTVRVVYTKVPSVLANNSDDFATVTGLPASMEDVIRLGAAHRMVAFLDSPHIAGSSAEADFSSNMRPAGSAGQLSKYLLQMYQLRLQDEAQKLQNLFQVRSHYTR